MSTVKNYDVGCDAELRYWTVDKKAVERVHPSFLYPAASYIAVCCEDIDHHPTHAQLTRLSNN